MVSGLRLAITRTDSSAGIPTVSHLIKVKHCECEDPNTSLKHTLTVNHLQHDPRKYVNYE
jgi:hypothetical protein